ncbi:MAG: hypothetical protein IT373_20630 [Polyangiaceae bacterium]|nr:hypothetical protein [Polyangiaceae bacterium]
MPRCPTRLTPSVALACLAGAACGPAPEVTPGLHSRAPATADAAAPGSTASSLGTDPASDPTGGPAAAASGASTASAPSASGTAGGSAPAAAPYVLAEAGCRVEVGAVLSAERFRGPGPMTPRLSDTLARDPAYARTYSGISHGDQHIQCRYRVQVMGGTYRYRFVIGNAITRYDVDRCELVRAEVASEIVAATRHCTDLHGGEYDGWVLEPL